MTGTFCEQELQANLPSPCIATHKDWHSVAYTCENYTAHTLRYTHVQILGRHSPWRMTSKARAQGINREPSQINGFQTGTLKATREFLHAPFLHCSFLLLLSQSFLSSFNILSCITSVVSSVSSFSVIIILSVFPCFLLHLSLSQ